MPRPVPPPANVELRKYLPTPEDRKAATLDKRGRDRLAHALGLPSLNDQYADLIEYLIAAYRRQRRGNRDTTVGTTLATITELIKAIERTITTRNPRARAKAQKLMDRIRDSRSGLAYEARARLLSCGEAPERIVAEAHALAVYYRVHRRTEPEAEVLRQFCGFLSLVFENIADPNAEDAQHRKLRRRRFALAVFDVAGLETGEL